MGVEWALLLPLLGVMVIAILITGPGLWSDAWGFWWVHKEKRPPRR
jgi:hypothetical protein